MENPAAGLLRGSRGVLGVYYTFAHEWIVVEGGCSPPGHLVEEVDGQGDVHLAHHHDALHHSANSLTIFSSEVQQAGEWIDATVLQALV